MPDEIQSSDSTDSHDLPAPRASSGTGFDAVGLGEISKVGRDLIRIFGRLWAEPRAIRALAHARADANRIETLSKTQVEIERRVMLERATIRMANTAIKSQENIELAVKNAVPLLEDKAKPENIDSDWQEAFMRHAGEVSDEEMRVLWSKILAGEANSPGSFTKRTLKVASELTKVEAELFTSLCSFDTSVGPLIFNLDDAIYAEKGLQFYTLTMLQDAGLINFDPVAGYSRNSLKEPFAVVYFRNPIFFTKLPETLPAGQVMLTTSGLQLSKVCQAAKAQEFSSYLLRIWKEFQPVEIISPEDPNALVTQQRSLDEAGNPVLGPLSVATRALLHKLMNDSVAPNSASNESTSKNPAA